jgi:Ca2+-binding EF-hand superfamily protein
MLSVYFLKADIDNSGTIDYGEFIAATLHMNKLEREENLVSAFEFFDKDGSGFITIDELSQACSQFGLDDVHLEDMIKDVDQNNVSLLTLSNSMPLFFFFQFLACMLPINFCAVFRMGKSITVSSQR